MQPYADAGIGLTEVIFDGERRSFTFGIGVQFRFNNWGIAIECRGLVGLSVPRGCPKWPTRCSLAMCISTDKLAYRDYPVASTSATLTKKSAPEYTCSRTTNRMSGMRRNHNSGEDG